MCPNPSTDALTGDTISRVKTSGRSWNRPPKKLFTSLFGHTSQPVSSVEKYDSIVCRALEKAELEEISNLKIMCIDAMELTEVFDKEISTIYLNFSDPWPKKRHAKRRLTSHLFLPIYDKIFKNENIIIQKTDNVGLFESSIVSLSTYGYVIEDISLDLGSTDKENSYTEYEVKFMSLGVRINYLKAIKK